MAVLTVRPLPTPLPSSTPEARTVVVDEPNAYPCRRCLRDAEPGEAVVLLSYDPFDADAATPYRQPGPIFVHAEPCAYEPSDALPDQLTHRLLSVRAFDDGHLMLSGLVIDGEELRSTAESLLREDGVSYLHVHNAGPGCFAARIERSSPHLAR